MSGLEVLAELEERCRRDEMIPVPVELGPLPERAGRVMREIAADIEWLIGVRLAAGYPLELPYSVSMAVARGWATDPSTASKALRTLVRLGVVRSAGTLAPQRPGLTGTKLYAPPERPSSVKAQPLVIVAASEAPLGALEDASAPEDALLDVLGSEEAVVAAFVSAFDATEVTKARWAA